MVSHTGFSTTIWTKNYAWKSDVKAELILLPELAPNQYIWHSSQWNFAEPINWYSVKWLQLRIYIHSKRLSVYLAMTFLEVDPCTLDIYNTFVMCDDTGVIIAI